MKTANLTEWTYEDYLALPEGPPYYEVIDGERWMTPPPNIRHQEISGRLFYMIYGFLLKNSMGKVFSAPCDVVFSRELLQVVEPDLVFVSTEHSSIITEKNIQGAPDLLVEILSPGTEKRDRQEKLRLYERFGVPEYWIVDPKSETVQVFRLVDGKYPAPVEFRKPDVLDSPQLHGLSIPLSEVFHS